MNKIMACAILALGIGLPRQSEAQYVQSDPFHFDAVNQNMWGGSGPASASYQQFLGLSFNQSVTLGGIVGSENDEACALGVCVPLGDTRTGLEITAQASGSIGLNVGATINAGSVDAIVPGQATLSTGQLGDHAPGSTFTIGTGYAIDPSATMHTQFPSVEAYADFVFDVNAGVQTKECFLELGCAEQGSPGNIINVNWTPELAAFNRNGDGALRVLGIDVPLSGSYSGVNYAFTVPNLVTDAAAPATGLQSSGDAYFLDLSVNVPAVIADVVAGAGAAFEGDLFGMHYTTLGVNLGPEFGIGQEFTFESTPMVTLDFSAPVSRVEYNQKLGRDVTFDPQSSWDVELGSDPNFVFPDAMTLDVTPTYWLKNSLTVNTDFLARLGLDVNVLSLTTSLGSLGPVYSNSWQTPSAGIGIDDRTFSLAFNTSQGSTFELTATPEPSTWILLGSGLLLLGVVGWRRPLGG